LGGSRGRCANSRVVRWNTVVSQSGCCYTAGSATRRGARCGAGGCTSTCTACSTCVRGGGSGLLAERLHSALRGCLGVGWGFPSFYTQLCFSTKPSSTPNTQPQPTRPRPHPPRPHSPRRAQVDPAAASEFHELQVVLTADYAPARLLELLSSSQWYPLEAALEICEQRGLVDEQVGARVGGLGASCAGGEAG